MRKIPRQGKLTGIRLTVAAQELLNGALKEHYGLRSTAAIVETLIREKAHELRATEPSIAPSKEQPPLPVISPDVDADDEYDALNT